jgi:hypothetical protein
MCVIVKNIIKKSYDKYVESLYLELLWNDGTLDKEATSCNDIFDAFRLALKFYQFEERTG